MPMVPELEGLHPVDVMEHLCQHHSWTFDRVNEDQLALVVEGQWRTYDLTMVWSSQVDTLWLTATFELEPPPERQPALYELLNLIHQECPTGTFTWSKERCLMIYSYGLILAGEAVANPEQLEVMIERAALCPERYYPAMQLTLWGNKEPREALAVAIAKAIGRA